jgi:hypothetical protein
VIIKVWETGDSLDSWHSFSDFCKLRQLPTTDTSRRDYL